MSRAPSRRAMLAMAGAAAVVPTAAATAGAADQTDALVPSLKVMLAAVQPITKGSWSKPGAWFADDALAYFRAIHGALAGIIGPRSVATAQPVLKVVSDAYKAGVGEDYDDEMSALDSVLSMFVAAGRPSGPDCVTTRATFVADCARQDDGEGLNSITAEVACKHLPADVGNLRSGRFTGELFDEDPRWIEEVLGEVRARDAG